MHASALSQHYLELARKPVNDSNFAGDDIRYSSEFESLEAELAKAGALHQTTGIDWQKVREGSELLLASLSKDLRAAAWLTWSLFQRESFAGLQAGLNLLQYLCSNHWNELHPRKPRTRAAAINWLLPRLEQTFSEDVPVGEQLPLFRSLAEQLHALEQSLSDHLGEDAPLLLPLCRQLDGMVKRASSGQAQPGTVGAAIAQVKQVASQVFAPGSPIENDKEALKAVRNLQEQARPLTAWWLKQRTSDLRPLRLARTLLWLSIDSLPEHNSEQITALRGVPADKLASYRERFAQGQYADLLVDLENSTARAPFWLDGQRLAWECLQELDAAQACARWRSSLHCSCNAYRVWKSCTFTTAPRSPTPKPAPGSAARSCPMYSQPRRLDRKNHLPPAPCNRVGSSRCRKLCRYCARTASNPPYNSSNRAWRAPEVAASVSSGS